MKKTVFILLFLHSVSLPLDKYDIQEKAEKLVLCGVALAVLSPFIIHALKNGWGVEIAANNREFGVTFNNSGRFGVMPKFNLPEKK